MSTTTRAQARLDILDWIEGFYNHRSLHSSTGYRTPAHVAESNLMAAKLGVRQIEAGSLSDLGQVNAQVAQFVTGANYLKDVNVSGTLSLADKGIANAQLTRALPAP